MEENGIIWIKNISLRDEKATLEVEKRIKEEGFEEEVDLNKIEIKFWRLPLMTISNKVFVNENIFFINSG